MLGVRKAWRDLADTLREIQQENDRLKAENAQLRELVVLWSVINKHMSLCATTDCGQCPVREECGESVYLEGLLGIDLKGLSWRVQERMADADDVQTENAKLRTFIDLKETCWKYIGWCDECPYNGVDDEHDNCNCTMQEKINSLARELGIKVD